MFFFFNDTATTEIYTLSLHDALPISAKDSRQNEEARAAQTRHGGDDQRSSAQRRVHPCRRKRERDPVRAGRDRKSTRLNSSHLVISYAVFCLKKKKHY